MLSSSKRLLLWGAFILCCFGLLIQQVVVQDKLPIETNILALLPENQQDKVAQQAFEQIADNINNRVAFMVKGDNKDNIIKAAQYFSQALPQLELFSHIEAQINNDQQQAWGTLYFPYRSQLLSDLDKQQLQSTPEQRINHVIQQLYSPFSGVSGNELKSDPFLLFRDYLKTRNNSNNQFSLYQNYLLSEVEGNHYLLIQADLAGDAYDTSLQSLLPRLQQLENEVENMFHVELFHTGTIFYAAYGTESAKGEISTIGVGSLIGIVLLLLFVYRSTLPLMLALLSISCGLLVAFVVTVLVFGKVHLFSLVFGASLIGVSIDYAFHYLTERLAHPKNWDADFALKQIFNAITLGLITSLIGYLGLLVAPFPGLQQLSLFSLVGLFSAYLTVVLCYPALAIKASKTRQPNLQLLTAWLLLWSNKRLRITLPSVLVFLALIGLTQIHFDDDIHQLQAMPESLKTQEQLIKNITGVGSNQRLLLVKANSEELLLQYLEQITEQFDHLKADGVISNVQSVSQFVPSIKTQQSNYQLIKTLYETQGEKLRNGLNMIDPIEFKQTFEPLLVDAYLNSSVSDAFGFLWLGKVSDQYASIIVLSDITDTAKVESYVAQQEELSILDKSAEVSNIFAHYRVFIGEMLLLAYFVIGLLLIKRYRIHVALKVLLPPFIAGIVALAITAVFAIPITIFNLLALLLVLGIGIDYTLFFAEQKNKINNENTLLAITLSAITTVLSFGLLALSETQAIHGFGITVLTGIIVAWLLAPMAMHSSPKKES